MLTKTATCDIVTRFELAAMKRDRAKLDGLKKQTAALAESLREREERIIERIEGGVPVDGDAVVMTRRRQNISWLTAFRKELGPDAVIRIKNQWPVCFWKELQIA